MNIQSLRTRFIIAGCSILAVTVASGIWSVWTFDRLGAAHVRSLNDNQTAIDLAVELIYSLERQDDALLQFWNGDAGRSAVELKKQRDLFQKNYQQLGKYVSNTDDKNAYAALLKHEQQYLDAGDAFIAATKTGEDIEQHYNKANTLLSEAVADCRYFRASNVQAMRLAGTDIRQDSIHSSFVVGGLTLSAFLLSASIVTALTRSVLLPIKELDRGFDAIRHDDLSQRVPVRSNDELGRLAEGFNRMTEALAKYRREADDRFRQLAENIHEIFWISDLAGNHISYISPAYEDVWGRTCASLYENPGSWFECIHVDDRDMVRANVQQRLDGLFRDIEFRVQRPDNSLRWIRCRTFPMVDSDGRAARVIGLAEDISERKLGEDEIRRANDRMELAVRGSNLGIWEFDMPNGGLEASRQTFINVWESLGYDPLESPTHFPDGFQLGVHPDDQQHVYQAIEAFLASTHQQFEVEYRAQHKDGSTQWRLARGTALRNPDGTPTRFIGTFVNITDFKRAEAALRESEHRFRTFADHATDAFFLHDEDYITLDVNRRACESLGYSRSELIGMTPIDFDPVITSDAMEKMNADLDRGEVIAFETRHRRKDGTEFPVEIRGQSFWEGGRRFTVALARDITERRRSEMALRDSEERFRGTFENAAVGMAHCDLEGRYLRVNEKYCHIVGYPREEMLNRTFFDMTYQEDLESSREKFVPLGRGELTSYAQEKRIVRKDGSQRWIYVSVSLQRDPTGKPLHSIGVLQDITERKQLEGELRDAKEAAEAANRAKDEFLANVSHEIRTPMNAILGMTELVLDSPLPEVQRQCLFTVKSAADNLLEIINDLLDFSRIEAGKMELDLTPFSLRAALSQTLRALAVRAHSKGLELISKVNANVPDTLVGDIGRLRQVLINLIGNAIKFTEKGEVVLCVEATESSDDESMLRFIIRDTGIGIPLDKQEVIFRAFEQEDVSTTRKFGGTGLGLTIATRLAQLMSGGITVESTQGQGSTFTFTARFQRQKASSESATQLPSRDLDNLRVLIVDDNATNRRLLEEWTRTWSMLPTSVPDATMAFDALEVAVNKEMPYSLVILDARMPRVDGLMLAANIRRRSELAATPLILLTSGDRPADWDLIQELQINAHLLKPLQKEELLETICRVLSNEGPKSSTLEELNSLSEPPKPGKSSPLRILVAEDNELNAQLVEMLLAKQGHSVQLVGNGREAFEIAVGGGYDVLLLDIHMPEMDGFQVIEAIRSHESRAGGHLHVIALTARSRNEDRARCLAAGMDAFLVKPIAASELWETLEVLSSRNISIPPMDRSLLNPKKLLAVCGEDPEILFRICEAITARLPAEISVLRHALDRGDLSSLREGAHKLCGIVEALSSSMGKAASQLEELATTGDLSDCAPVVASLETYAAKLIQQSDGLSVDILRDLAAKIPSA